MKQPGLFDLEERHEALNNQGDPLEVLNDSVHWATFRPILKNCRIKIAKAVPGAGPMIRS
ncbi:MAG: hypothetical protein AB2693_09710 [Candidatus Thiodiazotropha sp.]